MSEWVQGLLLFFSLLGFWIQIYSIAESLSRWSIEIFEELLDE